MAVETGIVTCSTNGSGNKGAYATLIASTANTSKEVIISMTAASPYSCVVFFAVGAAGAEDDIARVPSYLSRAARLPLALAAGSRLSVAVDNLETSDIASAVVAVTVIS